MKTKILTGIALSIMSMTLLGCGTLNSSSTSGSNETEQATSLDAYTNDYNIQVFVDPDTGVNYIIYNSYEEGGITVRLNADGTPYVTDNNEVEE